jgi:hypothetical protein
VLLAELPLLHFQSQEFPHWHQNYPNTSQTEPEGTGATQVFISQGPSSRGWSLRLGPEDICQMSAYLVSMPGQGWGVSHTPFSFTLSGLHPSSPGADAWLPASASHSSRLRPDFSAHCPLLATPRFSPNILPSFFEVGFCPTGLEI